MTRESKPNLCWGDIQNSDRGPSYAHYEFWKGPKVRYHSPDPNARVYVYRAMILAGVYAFTPSVLILFSPPWTTQTKYRLFYLSPELKNLSYQQLLHTLGSPQFECDEWSDVQTELTVCFMHPRARRLDAGGYQQLRSYRVRYITWWGPLVRAVVINFNFNFKFNVFLLVLTLFALVFFLKC